MTLRKITDGRRRRSDVLLVGGTSRRVTKTNSLSRHFSIPRLSLRPASVSGSTARGSRGGRVRYIEVIDLMRFAVNIEHRLCGIGSKTHRSGLVRRSADQNVLS